METLQNNQDEISIKNQSFLEEQRDILRTSVEHIDKEILKALSHFCSCSVTTLIDTIKLRLKDKSLATVTLKNTSAEKEVSQ